MENNAVSRELRKGGTLCMIIAMTFLALIIICVNRILDWEVWMLPVIIVGSILCWTMVLKNLLEHRMQIYLIGVFFIFLEFYYCIRITTVYDCSAFVLLMIFVFAFTREKPLIWAGIISSFSGLFFHLVVVRQRTGLKLDLYSVVRTFLAFLMIPMAGLLVYYIVKTWTAMEKDYQRRIGELSRESDRANNFLANMSHEVRTPIGAVIGLSHVLGKSAMNTEDRDKLRAISEAGFRISEQISDILDFSEVEMCRVAIHEESYMMNSLINDLLMQLSQTDNYGLDLVIDIDPKLPAVLYGDEMKIRRILWHLIRNGYKFTKYGGVCARLTFVKREYGINLMIEVRDTGSGMSEEEIDNSYEKFYQADSGRSRSKGGLGLGIPIVGGFVKSMGGVFTIESTPGEGTSVRVSIPQAVEDPSPGIAVADGRNCVVAGFLGFMTTGHPKIREYYMEMIAHLSLGLSIPFHRVQSRQELEKLVSFTGVTHLFVGTGEYQENREYIDSLALQMNVAMVADRGFVGEVSEGITILPKPFCGTQVASFLNHAFSRDEIEIEEAVSFPGLKALVVDDERMNLIVAREIFSGYGMEISMADSGEQAIAMCRENNYDIVFMDHMMPGMDGVEAMHRIKQNAAGRNSEICVVALTANAISSAREMFLSEGFDGFIPKPIEINELERVLKRVLPRSAVTYTRESRHRKEKRDMAPAEAGREASVQAAGQVPAQTAAQTSAETPPEAQTADPMEVLKEYGLDTDYGMNYCGGDREFYEELLAEYSSGREGKLKELEQFVTDRDWYSYEIRVHSIKSTSAMIGASSVSAQAKALEAAAKSGDEDFILNSYSAFMEDYRRLLDGIAELAEIAGQRGLV